MYWKESRCPQLNNKHFESRSYHYFLDASIALYYVYVSGKDSCFGDSGGPLVYRKFSPWYQVGIVSYGPSKCGNGNGGVYTRITSFLPWIESKLEP